MTNSNLFSGLDLNLNDKNSLHKDYYFSGKYKKTVK